jgi:Mg-chelatase subunit ChlD
MSHLMRCPYCGLLQDEPSGVKTCARCGGALEYETQPPTGKKTYLQVQMELDQVAAPPNQNVERYLLLTLKTPKEIPPEEMPPARQSRPPVNFCAVLDVSGSMQGEKIENARRAVRQAAQYLRPGDIFSLVTFNDQISCSFEPAEVEAKFMDAIDACLQTIRAGGSTALDGGLEMGIQKALTHKLETNLVMLLSDGQANVGVQDLELIGMRALQARRQGVLVSALGIGLDYNEALMAEIASQGGGRFYHLEHPGQIPAYVAGELQEVALLAARDTRVNLTLPAGATLVPLSAAFPVQQEKDQAIILAGDIPCDTELEIPLHLALLGQASDTRLSVEGSVTFRSPAGHDLEAALNRVTVRFLKAGVFKLREGVVAPVVEHVLEQMLAVDVLGASRLMARQPGVAEQQADRSLDSIRQYASLLSDERAEMEANKIRERFNYLHQSPAAAKQAVADAFAFVHRSKKHK